MKYVLYLSLNGIAIALAFGMIGGLILDVIDFYLERKNKK